MKAFLLYGVLLVLGTMSVISFKRFDYLSNSTPLVSTQVVQKTTFVKSIEKMGKVVARRITSVKTSSGGILRQARIRVGTAVTKGALLAIVKPRDEEIASKSLKLRLLELDHELNELNLQQAVSLFAEKAISEKELKQAKLANMRTKIKVQNLRNEISEKQIIAPMDGILIEQLYLDGSEVASNVELFTLIDPNSIQVKIWVHQSQLGMIHEGQEVIFASEFLEGRQIGQISEVSLATLSQPQAIGDALSNNFLVYVSSKASWENNLSVGVELTAKIVLSRKANTISIPLEAVLYRDDKEVVFILESRVAKQRRVKLGESNTDSIEILSGLSEGEKVIIRGHLDLEDGMTVKLK